MTFAEIDTPVIILNTLLRMLIRKVTYLISSKKCSYTGLEAGAEVSVVFTFPASR